MSAHIAIDIGASSGRVMLVDDNKHQEIHRFANNIVDECWDVSALYEEILVGMRKIDVDHATVAIDTWGCDVVYLDEHDKRLCNPRSYRYCDTDEAIRAVHERIPENELYAMTGTQFQPFNTIYQIMRDMNSGILSKAKHMMFMAEYLMFCLTGQKHQELTMASTSQLLNLETMSWHETLIERLGYPSHLFTDISIPGTVLGPVIETLPYPCVGIVTGSHDTACAFHGAQNQNELIVSCGTWALVGVCLETKITNNEAKTANMTNEVATDGRIRFLKNIPGMWPFENIREHYANLNYDTLLEEARNNSIDTLIDLQDERLLMPTSMVETINTMCKETKQKQPQNVGEYVYCILNSLAHEIVAACDKVSTITKQTYTVINIVGGGSQNTVLRERIAALTKRELISGPIEASVIGNYKGTLMKRSDYDESENT